MADNVDGFQFDNVKVSAANDAKLYHTLAQRRNYVIKGYEQELRLSKSGLKITVGAGCALVQGRFIYLKEAQTITVPANSSGYIVLRIDLTQEVVPDLENDPATDLYTWTNNQVSLEWVTSLVNGNLNQGDKVYTFSLCSFNSNGSNVNYELNESNYKGYVIVDRTKNTDPALKAGQIRFIRTGDFVLVHCSFQTKDAGLKAKENIISKVPENLAIDFSSHISLTGTGELLVDAQTQAVSTVWGLKGNTYYLGTGIYLAK
ncbi:MULTISPECIES: hypothetical protein [Enterococcus]|uniref:Uncharacterized protein n=2 Tax=Enterococcus TaxID=1350 RepID=R2QXQ6_9ENTE|nr:MULTISPECIES: hypothetical protein [Enterococcus]EOH76215.1 hypothetical protein UAK_03064 [Enterococcus raffinosus ATCC 49464]MBX9121933.1 hypothetical protein [Enterococcus sp. K18_3]OFN66421.1 hypothetical protein HMPREF2539_14020 [Enterococcus sp. HMSC064A12]EOT45745.1 hypothetical protein OMU_02169 [Enterococcus avium ATCC 14025]EOT76182.1 hypothetical protein I590_03007 [Enterococcus raffinosus ATCC 49464]